MGGVAHLEGEGVGVLEEVDPLDALALPLAERAGRVEQVVHVAVPVRLRQQLVRVLRVERERRVVVGEAGHLLLLEQRDLPLGHPKVVILLEQGGGARGRVVRHHDRQRQLHRLALGGRRLLLHREDRADVELEVGLAGGGLPRQRDLDARVAQPLAQPARHQHEREPTELRHPELLVLEERVAAEVERRARGHARRPALERIDAGLGLGEELARVAHVALHAARVGRVELRDLPQQALLVVVGRLVGPAREHVVLVDIGKVGARSRLDVARQRELFQQIVHWALRARRRDERVVRRQALRQALPNTWLCFLLRQGHTGGGQ